MTTRKDDANREVVDPGSTLRAQSVVVPLDPSKVPGAMQTTISRPLPDGSIVNFSSAPSGWLTKDGKRRVQPWRAYTLTEPGGKPKRLPSVTTWLGTILPKDLTRYGEEHGIRGMAELVRRGEWDPQTNTDEDAVSRVRALKLGAEAATDRAAKRGTNAHKLVETFLETGEPPSPQDWLPEMHGYLRALTRWLLKADPQPIEVEQLVASREHGYAGRMDLIADLDGERCLCDFKTNVKGQVYSGAHYQVASYRRAALECGSEPFARTLIVVFSADGEFREMDGCVTDEALDDALRFYRSLQPVNSACERANRVEREARRAA